MLQCIVLLLVVRFKFEFPEFEFELNCLNQFKKCKAISFFLFLFSTQHAHLFLPLPLFPFLSRGPKLYRRPSPSPSPQPSSTPHFPFPLSHRQAGPARQAFLLPPPVCAMDSAESARRLSSALRLARTPRASAPAYIRRSHPPGTLSSPSRHIYLANPSASPLLSLELGAAVVPSLRRALTEFESPRSFVSR